jgi:basic membrane protein A
VKSNTGTVVLDKGYGNYDPILEKMDYLVEGVAGTLG